MFEDILKILTNVSGNMRHQLEIALECFCPRHMRLAAKVVDSPAAGISGRALYSYPQKRIVLQLRN